MKVAVSLRQKKYCHSITKVIELAAMPVPGCYFEYENGYSACCLVAANESGLHLYVTANEVAVDGYGPQFTESEIKDLVELGWKCW